MRGNRLRLLGCFGFVVAAVSGLHAAGGGALSSPRSLTALPQWAATHDPITAAFVLLRLLALALGYYLLFEIVAGAGFRLARTARLAAAADLFTVPAVRRLLDGCLGLAMLAAVSAPSAIAFAADQPGAPAAPVMHWLGPSHPAAAAPALPAPTPPQVAPASPTWTIRKGDHLWGVAHATLATARGRAVSDAEVAPYWVRLVQMNRSRLSDPHNPDLVFIGQRMLLPPL